MIMQATSEHEINQILTSITIDSQEERKPLSIDKCCIIKMNKQNKQNKRTWNIHNTNYYINQEYNHKFLGRIFTNKVEGDILQVQQTIKKANKAKGILHIIGAYEQSASWTMITTLYKHS